MKSIRMMFILLFWSLMCFGPPGAAQGLWPKKSDLEKRLDNVNLVYLVSVRELKVGAEVFVIPIFVSDGEKAYSLIEYCNAVYGSDGARSNKRRDFNRHPESRVCWSHEFDIPAGKMTALDNFGRTLTLTDAKFKADEHPDHGWIHAHGPYTPKTGIAGIKTIQGAKPYPSFPAHLKSKIKTFFLMSDNPRLLKRLIPQSRLTKEEVAQAIEQATPIVEQYQGRSHTVYGRILEDSSLEWIFKSIGDVKSGGSASWGPVLVGDLDGDGKSDIVVGVMVNFPSKANGIRDSTEWSATIALFADGKHQVNGVLQVQGMSEEVWRDGRTENVPLALVRLGQCQYVAYKSIGGTDSLTIRNLLYPPTPNCNGFVLHNALGECADCEGGK